MLVSSAVQLAVAGSLKGAGCVMHGAVGRKRARVIGILQEAAPVVVVDVLLYGVVRADQRLLRA